MWSRLQVYAKDNSLWCFLFFWYHFSMAGRFLAGLSQQTEPQKEWGTAQPTDTNKDGCKGACHLPWKWTDVLGKSHWLNTTHLKVETTNHSSSLDDQPPLVLRGHALSGGKSDGYRLSETHKTVPSTHCGWDPSKVLGSPWGINLAATLQSGIWPNGETEFPWNRVSLPNLWLTSLPKTLFPLFLSPTCFPQEWGASDQSGDWNPARALEGLLRDRPPAPLPCSPSLVGRKVLVSQGSPESQETGSGVSDWKHVNMS